MAAESKKEIQVEIAHVLFIDIVGYSKLSVNEQHAAVEELNQIVRASEQFRKAEGDQPNLEDSHWRWHGAGVLLESLGTCAVRL